jgi:3-phosphoshikimate 1-carboxyvinyltransferase
LLAALQAASSTTVIEPGPSRDHTERMLKAMGVDLETDLTPEGLPRVRVAPLADGVLTPLKMRIPGDFSSAAFLLTAAAILPGSKIRLQKTGLNSTRTGLMDALRGMGHQLSTENTVIESGEPLGDVVLRSGDPVGVQVSGDLVVRMIDEFPAFAVAAAFARGQTIVREAAELRHKESDRIEGICRGLSALGLAIQPASDGFTLQGQTEDLKGGVELWPGKDHRLAMAFVLAGLRCQKPILIHGAEIIHQSFPTFLESLQALGVDSFEVLDD